MFKIRIATGKSRQSQRWDNTAITWREFVERCTTATRTKETATQYSAMTKDRKGAVKDVGGFVGGHLLDGIRKRDKVLFRSCLTLDADNASKSFWETFTEHYTCAAVCYSTHSHTPEAPRLRLVIPFSREVPPEEYEAISRRVADAIGIDQIDHTTHDLNRLFYWPSTSADAEFYSREQRGVPLDVDEVLATYEDWRDRSQWPMAECEREAIRAKADKAQDPCEKPGVIGAFCRTYTIGEAIEKYLPDVYEACDTAGENRYTYKAGSTAGGAVVYEDKFLYSHHDTDPAGGELHNAFDLVRVHKFGWLDSKAKPGTPVNKLPSYLAMSDLCINDKATKLRLMKEKTAQAAEDFAAIDADGAEDWRDQLALDRKGNVLNTLNNVKLIIFNDEEISKTRYNMQARRDEVYSEMLQDCGQIEISEGARVRMCLRIENEFGLKLAERKLDNMMKGTATERSYNPVKDFITSTEWDGTKRVDTLLIDYLGADDTAENREVTRKWMVAAVARVFQPGYTFQNVLTLTGPQGIGKSHFLKTLAGNGAFFCDGASLDTDEKQRVETMRGAMIVELAELGGIGKTDWGKLKNFISRDADKMRMAYNRDRTDAPRNFVFAATTNETDFLREASKGNRRWWIVPTTRRGKEWPTDPQALHDEVAQIWAEAYRLYINGEGTTLSKATAQHQEQMQWEHSEDAADPMPGEIDAFLEVLLPPDWETYTPTQQRTYYRDRDPLSAEGTVKRNTICAAIYLWEGVGISDKSPLRGKLIRKFNAIMQQKPDWIEQRIYFYGSYGRQRGFTRKPQQEDDEI